MYICSTQKASLLSCSTQKASCYHALHKRPVCYHYTCAPRASVRAKVQPCYHCACEEPVHACTKCIFSRFDDWKRRRLRLQTCPFWSSAKCLYDACFSQCCAISVSENARFYVWVTSRTLNCIALALAMNPWHGHEPAMNCCTRI